MSENEKQQNIDIDGNVDKSAIIDGNQNITNQNIVNINVHLKAILIFLCLTISIAAAAYVWNKYRKPKFVIENQILRSDAAIIIRAANDAAKRKEPLTVEFDGFQFSEKGIPLVEDKDNPGKHRWYFSLKNQNPPPEMLKDGAHQIRAGFFGEDSVDVQKIIFHTKVPIIETEFSQTSDSDGKEIKVRAASELQIPENILSVEMVFYHEGEPQTLNLPIKKVHDPKTGIICYEFQTKIQGFKEFSDKDPRRAEPFFGLKVTDQAGNSYYQEQSYAQYMAPGTNRFGVNDLASITVEKVPDAVSKQFIHLVRLTPQPKRVDQLSDGVPPIKLEKVELKTDNSRYLEWKSRVKDVKGLTLVFRDEQQIGVSTTDSYIDNEKLDKVSADYRVEQEGKDGTRYVSNTETFRKSKYNLRSKPITVSDEEFKTVFKLDKNQRPLEYVKNDFKDNGNGTITDHATGLMWQKSGSPDYLYLKDVPAYIEKLNREKFAGYSDWRLPTIDELKSLITNNKQSNDLYINPIFEKKKDHNWFWSSDKRASGGAWGVDFFSGDVDWNSLGSVGDYVRAVRSVK